ncbi:hypothetical protein QEZ40_003233 [Streptomyces katrae]|uniref:Uncharacterized protein n=1 Tax=Streptomyces katrae TaxID=68223 RepID=A0ABT7GXC7_9ACTN|nr:hypothetical protein [Streptomyces katrae]MDK9498282.1 hypothetical protein [Streptomyces katrae]
MLGGALLVSAGLVTGCTGGSVQSRDVSQWVDGVSAEDIARSMQVRVPASASDVKAAYQKGFQDDQLLLAFVLPAAEVDGFLAQLKPTEPVKAGPKSFAGPEPVAPFAHIGLPEPDSVAGVRTAQVCAPCAGDVDFMHVAVAQVDERTSRVYLQATD